MLLDDGCNLQSERVLSFTCSILFHLTDTIVEVLADVKEFFPKYSGI